jgi:hypothetical protein
MNPIGGEHAIELMLTSATTILFIVAAFFLKQFVSDVRALSQELREHKYETNERLTKLETINEMRPA